MVALAPISAVAALWFVPRLIAIALRKVRRPGYYEREKARRQALAHERLSTRRRTTLNPIPVAYALTAAEAPDSDVVDHAGGGDVGGAEDMQSRCGPKSCETGGATQGAMRERGREGEMQLRCGPRLEEARGKAEEILGGCQDTKKDLAEMLAMLLEPDRTPASPREGFPERDGRVPRLRGLLPSALA